MKVLKNIARVTSLSVGLLSFAAAQSFEGVIEMQVKSLNQESLMPMKYFVKGDFIRMEMQSPQGEMAMIMDSKNKKTVMLMPQMQSYMERTIDAPPAGEAKKSEITKTGKTEKILAARTIFTRPLSFSGKPSIVRLRPNSQNRKTG